MMNSPEELATAFERHRAHLRAVAYHLTGSLSDSDDAVQEAWLRLARTDPAAIGNLAGWLTTVVARLCLDMLRSRGARREDALPDPVVGGPDGGAGPEHEVLRADAVGLAMLVVLDTLSPAERTAFVLHDVFAVPFDDVARLTGRSRAAARQLASRGRRRVRTGVPPPDPDPVRRRAVADAFLAAAREGDFDALLRVLDPGVASTMNDLSCYDLVIPTREASRAPCVDASAPPSVRPVWEPLPRRRTRPGLRLPIPLRWATRKQAPTRPGLRISKRWPMGGEVDEKPEETSETAADDAAGSEAVEAEGDAEDPETKATRREGLN